MILRGLTLAAIVAATLSPGRLARAQTTTAAEANAAPLPDPEVLRKFNSNYFLFAGLGHPERQVKFQVSIRYGIVTLPKGFTLNFAYTQASWWNLYSDSSPMVESNYAPELFLEWRRSPCLQPVDTSFSFDEEADTASQLWRAKRAGNREVCTEEREKLTNLIAGLWAHQSNGAAGGPSRGWDRGYLQATFKFRFGDGRPVRDRGFLEVVPRAWVIYDSAMGYDPVTLAKNPPISTYYGFGDLRLTGATPASSKGQQVELEWMFRKGWLDNPYGALQASLRARPWPKSAFSPWVLVQWWYGYGQRLNRYDQLDDEIRIGLVLND